MVITNKKVVKVEFKQTIFSADSTSTPHPGPSNFRQLFFFRMGKRLEGDLWWIQKEKFWQNSSSAR